MFELYIGDQDEDEILAWLQETIDGLERSETTGPGWFSSYYGMNDSWIMSSSDVSDTGSNYDRITLITLKSKEDAIMCGLRFGVVVQHG